MRDPVLLIDFGSTYTKVTAVDVEGEQLLGTAQSYTTVETDVGNGLNHALSLLEEKIGPRSFSVRYACSSAAGGLRMCASGLVPELTSEAARLAALGAGAKVIKTYSYRMTDSDIREMESLRPDIILLTGGTDGGDTENILSNAHALAASSLESLIILAGNRCCAEECARILEHKPVTVTENVMPKFNALNIEPAQSCIRSAFLERIVRAKGLTAAQSLLDGIVMPTPGAVLRALKLLAQGTDGESGIGDLIGVDLGGATTDVYSMCEGAPRQLNTVMKGLIEPYAKRSVEGDIGMRYSIGGIVENSGLSKVARMAELSEEATERMVRTLRADPEHLPTTKEEHRLDKALASCAVDIATQRHAGTLESVCTPCGWAFSQTGKDLRSVEKVILTGGALIHTADPASIGRFALANPAVPCSLRPEKAEILVDRNYILAAMGLLSQHHPQCALRIMKKEMETHGIVQQETDR